LFLVLLRRLWPRSWRPGQVARALRTSGPPVFRLYRQAEGRLSSEGWTRAPAETPNEFALRLHCAAVPGAAAMAKLTRHYVAARYGEHDVPPEVLAALAAEAEKIGRKVAPKAAPTA
jgi:hypothetical protein